MEAVDKWAFIDESGNEGLALDKENVSSHYVITGMLVDDDRYRDVKDHCEEVRARNFQGATEMKSGTVRRDETRRRKIVEELVAAEFSLYVLVVDKEKLTSTGFGFPKSFIKNLYNRLYSNIMKDFHHVHVRADRLKGRSFMDEFTRYINSQHEKTLWQTWDFEFVDSKSHPCVQAADFISGTIARGFENKVTTEQHDEYMQILKSRLSYFWLFPEPYRSYTHEGHKVTGDGDDVKIEKRAYAEAYRFLDEKASNKEQVACLQAIVSHSFSWCCDGWIQTREIRNKLKGATGEEVGDQQLRGIIGRLKDAGVLIASRRAGGYKLPTCKDDVFEFVNTQNSKIGPMIDRVRKARDVVLRATGFDILDGPAYENLKLAIDASRPWKIEVSEDAE